MLFADPLNYILQLLPTHPVLGPWIHLENFVLKRSFWGLKILIKTFLKTCCEDHFLHLQVPWFHAYPLHILQGQSSEKLGPDYVSTAIFMNTIGNHDNRFHQNFHSNTKVEKVINVPCHLDFELNRRKLCLPFSFFFKLYLHRSIQNVNKTAAIFILQLQSGIQLTEQQLSSYKLHQRQLKMKKEKQK